MSTWNKKYNHFSRHNLMEIPKKITVCALDDFEKGLNEAIRKMSLKDIDRLDLYL